MSLSISEARALVTERFSAAEIPLEDVQLREFPQETIFVVKVAQDAFDDAAQVATAIDVEFSARGFSGFVTVRKSERAPETPSKPKGPLRAGLQDPRVDSLIQLLITRSRASESQPALSYVLDAAANLAATASRRHHLVFGRRGAGKTSLLLEARREVSSQEALTAWLNIQTLRREPHQRVFLWILRSVLDVVRLDLRRAQRSTHTADTFEKLDADVECLLGAKDDLKDADVTRLIPRVQTSLQRYLAATAKQLFVFLDDFHYLDQDEQPEVLDMIHGCVRDAPAYLKIACIKNLSRWWQPHPPKGLQTGQDTGHVDLDVTLEHPQRAKAFLEEVLKRHGAAAHVSSLGQLFNAEALDRLVLAAGAVPRDYLVLAASALRLARLRPKARVAGVEDVNRAAGEIAKVKVSELEDDAASRAGSSGTLMATLQVVRRFCLETRACTYFRIEFRDKEAHSSQYRVMSELMDVRLLHLVNPSVSDEHHAGERSEVYMLDLSEYSSQRLRKKLRVLDFQKGHLVLKETGTAKPVRVGSTPNQLLSILRRGPAFDLSMCREDGQPVPDPAALQVAGELP